MSNSIREKYESTGSLYQNRDTKRTEPIPAGLRLNETNYRTSRYSPSTTHYSEPQANPDNPPVLGGDQSILNRFREEDLERIKFYTENNSRFLQNQENLYKIPTESRLPQKGDFDFRGVVNSLANPKKAKFSTGGIFNSVANAIDVLTDKSQARRVVASFFGSSLHKSYVIPPRLIQRIIRRQTFASGTEVRYEGVLSVRGRYLPIGARFQPRAIEDVEQIGFLSNLKNARLPARYEASQEYSSDPTAYKGAHTPTEKSEEINIQFGGSVDQKILDKNKIDNLRNKKSEFQENLNRANSELFDLVGPPRVKYQPTFNRNKRTPLFDNYGRLRDEDKELHGATGDKVNNKPAHRNDADYGQDFIKFRFKLIRSLGENNNDIILNFRAFLESFQDNHGANWTPHTYVGRAEQFYTYGGYYRTVNMSFYISALTRAELKPIYDKLNHLSSATTPSYTNGNIWMQATLCEIDVGNYFHKQPCVVNSINYSIEPTHPWEIGESTTEPTTIPPALGFGFSALGAGARAITPRNRGTSLETGDNNILEEGVPEENRLGEVTLIGERRTPRINRSIRESKTSEQLPHILKCDMSLNLIHNFVPQVSDVLESPYKFVGASERLQARAVSNVRASAEVDSTLDGTFSPTLVPSKPSAGGFPLPVV